MSFEDLGQLGNGDEFSAGAPPPQQPELPPATDLDYRIKNWDDERLRKLGVRICIQIDKYLEATEPRRNLLPQWRRDHEMIPSGLPGPWPNSSDVPTNTTRSACDNTTTRLNQQIINATPPFSCVAREPEAIDAAPRIEEALSAVLEEADWPVHADEVHGLIPRDGNCFFRTTYEIEHRRTPTKMVDVDEEMAQALMQAGVDAPDAMYSGLATDKQGALKQKLGFENVLTYQGIRFRAIPWEDGVIIPASVRNWEQATGIGEFLTVSGEDLRRGVKIGKYLRTPVDELLQFEGDRPIGTDEDETRWERLESQGLDIDDSTDWTGGSPDDEDYDDPDRLYAQYRCAHLCYRGDWNNDGEMEWARILVHLESQRILQFQYLPWAHGEPEYVLFPYLARPGELFGAGVAEIVAAIQAARTAILNQILNRADLMNALGSSLIIGRDARITIDTWEQKLGQPIFAEDPTAIIPFPIQPFQPEHYQALAMLKDEAELLTRTTNVSMGKETGGQKTLGEIQISAGNNNLQFEDAAARVARVWGKVFDQVRHLIAQYGDKGEVRYRKTAHPASRITGDEAVSGEPPAAVDFDSISSETLRAKVDLVPTGLAQLSDLQSRIQQASQAWQLLTPLPIVQGSSDVMLTLIDYVLTTLKVPPKDKIVAGIRAAYVQQMQAQMAMQQAAQRQAMMQQQGQSAELDAQHAGAEAKMQALAASEGIMPDPGGGPPMAAGQPMPSAMPPGNGAQPVGAL